MGHKKLSEEQLKLLSDSLMPTFAPKDKTTNSFIFHFTTEGISYRATYFRNSSEWKLKSVEDVTEIP